MRFHREANARGFRQHFDQQQQEQRFLGNWPTKYKSDSCYEIGVKGLYQYDSNRFSGDGALFDDAST